jgi:hypothetical protein
LKEFTTSSDTSFDSPLRVFVKLNLSAELSKFFG